LLLAIVSGLVAEIIAPKCPGEDAAERPPIVQIARRWVDDELIVYDTPDREPHVEPLAETAAWFIG
jgi:hypothetical protein